MALFCNRREIVYFDSFGVELVPEEIKEFVGNKNKNANIFWGTSKQVSNVWIPLHWIHDFMVAGEKLTDFTSLFFPYDFNKNDNIILSYFKDEWN